MAAPNFVTINQRNHDNDDDGRREEEIRAALSRNTRLYLLNTYDQRTVEISVLFNVMMVALLISVVVLEQQNPCCSDVKIWLTICVCRSATKLIVGFIIEHRRNWFVYRKFPCTISKISDVLDLFGMVS